MVKKRVLLGECSVLFCMICLVAWAMVVFSSSVVIAATETHTVHFRLNRVGNSIATDLENIPKGCYNQTMTGATVTMGPIFELTTGGGTNDSESVGYLRIQRITHNYLNLSVSGLGGVLDLHPGSLPNSIGQDVSPCSLSDPWPATAQGACGGNGNYNAGSWAYEIGVGATVNLQPFQTDAGDVDYAISAGNLPLFQASFAGETFPASLTAWADRTSDDPGTFSLDIRTDANGTIIVEYICESPGLTCNYKSLDGDNPLMLPSDTSFTPPHPVVVEISFSNGDVAQVVEVKDTFPNANWAYAGNLEGSAYFTNPPVQSGNEYTFTSNAAIPANTDVVFRFTANLGSGSVNPGSCLDNQVVMTGAIGGTSTCFASVCLRETQRVPSMNTSGAVILSLVMAGSAIWLLRRRRVS